MFLRHVYVAVEEHHEVRRDLIYIGLVFRYDRHVIAYVNRNRRKFLEIASRRGYFVFDFVMEAVKPVSLP